MDLHIDTVAITTAFFLANEFFLLWSNGGNYWSRKFALVKKMDIRIYLGKTR